MYKGQMHRIFNLMQDAKWRTLREISQATGDPPASISAQLRHLRKPVYGSHSVNSKTLGLRTIGLFQYQLIVNREDPPHDTQ